MSNPETKKYRLTITRKPGSIIRVRRSNTIPSIVSLKHVSPVTLIDNPFKIKEVNLFSDEIADAIYGRLLRISKLNVSPSSFSGPILSAILYNKWIRPNKVLLVRYPKFFSLARLIRNNLQRMYLMSNSSPYIHYKTPLRRLLDDMEDYMDYYATENNVTRSDKGSMSHKGRRKSSKSGHRKRKSGKRKSGKRK